MRQNTSPAILPYTKNYWWTWNTNRVLCWGVSLKRKKKKKEVVCCLLVKYNMLSEDSRAFSKVLFFFFMAIQWNSICSDALLLQKWLCDALFTIKLWLHKSVFRRKPEHPSASFSVHYHVYWCMLKYRRLFKTSTSRCWITCIFLASCRRICRRSPWQAL